MASELGFAWGVAAALLAIGCSGSPSAQGGGGAGAGAAAGSGGGSTCAPDEGTAADGSCFPVGVRGCVDAFVDADGVCRPSMSKCESGTIPKFDQGCVAVGVPQCAAAFVESDGLCHPRMAKCQSGEFATPQSGCLPVDGPNGCGAAPWGSIPNEPTNVYVDPSYTGTDGDGSSAKPLATIAAALAIVTPGGRVALADGFYKEALSLTRDVEIAGRCASKVTIDADDGDADLPKVIHVTSGTVTLRGMTIAGDGVGVFASSASAKVTLDAVKIQNALLSGIVAERDAAVTVTNSLILNSRNDPTSSWNTSGIGSGNGFGMSASRGATVTVTKTAFVQNLNVGVHAEDKGTSVTMTDTLVEGTTGPEFSYAGTGLAVENFGSDTYDTGARVDLRGVAIVDSAQYGINLLKSALGAPSLTADGVIIEGVPMTDSSRTQAGIAASGATLSVHASAILRNADSLEALYSSIDDKLVVTVDETLMTDGDVEVEDGAVSVVDSAVVNAVGSAFFIFPATIVKPIGHIDFKATRVLIESPLPYTTTHLFGYGLYVGSKAKISFDSIFVSKARGAGMLAEDASSVEVKNSTFADLQDGGFSLGKKTQHAADGIVVSKGGSSTLEGIRVERCGVAGIVFDNTQGAITKSISTQNQFGLVLEGQVEPKVDPFSSFEGNSTRGTLEDGTLPVPSKPAVPPQ